LQAAGLTDQQLETQDEKDQAMLENIKNPPLPGSKGPAAPGRNNMEKMLLAGVVNRMIRNGGPKFGVQTSSQKRIKSDRPFAW